MTTGYLILCSFVSFVAGFVFRIVWTSFSQNVTSEEASEGSSTTSDNTSEDSSTSTTASDLADSECSDYSDDDEDTTTSASDDEDGNIVPSRLAVYVISSKDPPNNSPQRSEEIKKMFQEDVNTLPQMEQTVNLPVETIRVMNLLNPVEKPQENLEKREEKRKNIRVVDTDSAEESGKVEVTTSEVAPVGKYEVTPEKKTTTPKYDPRGGNVQRLSFEEEVGLIQTFTELLVGEKLIDATEKLRNNNHGTFSVVPIYRGSEQSLLSEYDPTVIGVRISTKDLIITEIIDIGGIDVMGRGRVYSSAPYDLKSSLFTQMHPTFSM